MTVPSASTAVAGVPTVVVVASVATVVLSVTVVGTGEETTGATMGTGADEATATGSRISGDGQTQFCSPFGQVQAMGACRVSRTTN